MKTLRDVSRFGKRGTLINMDSAMRSPTKEGYRQIKRSEINKFAQKTKYPNLWKELVTIWIPGVLTIDVVEDVPEE